MGTDAQGISGESQVNLDRALVIAYYDTEGGEAWIGTRGSLGSDFRVSRMTFGETTLGFTPRDIRLMYSRGDITNLEVLKEAPEPKFSEVALSGKAAFKVNGFGGYEFVIGFVGGKLVAYGSGQERGFRKFTINDLDKFADNNILDPATIVWLK